MPWFSTLNVRYHQQNRRDFCGPAAAMMIIDALHGGLIQEETWWPAVESKSNGWDTDPHSLEHGLNGVPAAPLKNKFSAGLFNNEADGTRSIVEALCTPNAGPAAVLIYRKSHWVVASSVNLTAQPAAGVVPGVLGFYVNSPSLTPLHPPIVHANNDSCGTSHALGSTEANQYVHYDTWIDQFFTGFSNNGRLVFATVCPTRRTPIARLLPRIRPLAPLARDLKGKIVALTFIPPATATSDALKTIAEHGLAEGPLSDAVRNVEPGEPALVHRTDLPESYYYLIPLVRAKAVVGIARTDAVHGGFMGAGAVHDATFHVRAVDDVQREVPAGCRVTEIVWEPCRESTSPFSPFHRVVGPRGDYFVDQSGHVFDKLTPLSSGD